MQRLETFEDVQHFLVFQLKFSEVLIDGLAWDIVSIATEIVEKFKMKRNVELNRKNTFITREIS